MKITPPLGEQASDNAGAVSVIAGDAAAATPLGGDLSGTPPAATVTGIGGIPVDVSDTTDGNVLTYVAAGGDIELKPPSAGGLSSVTDGVVTVSPVTSSTVPLGGVTDLTGGNAGLNFVTPTYGGQEVLHTVAVSGASQTLDLADGNVHDVTLSADCAITTAGWQSGVSSSMSLVIRPAGFDPTFTDTIDWLGGVTPTWPSADDQYVVVLWSFDGGTTIGGTLVGSGTGATALDDLSDVTITGPALGDMLRFDGSVWVNVVGRWEPVTTNPGTGPELVWSGDAIVMAWNPV